MYNAFHVVTQWLCNNFHHVTDPGKRFPALLVLLDVLAAADNIGQNSRMVVYWLAAAALTIVVTW